jgi:ATP-dependent protease ClpP protease subunit
MNKWYSIRRPLAVAAAAGALAAGAAAPVSAEIWIYGDIGESWWGETVEAKSFVKELAALQADVIAVRINSYGGSVSDGIAIHNALKRHPATINTTVDGIAASIASLIFMAGEKREIAANAQVMVHAPWAVVGGNSAELREYADRLDLWAQSMATSYASATGKSVEDVMVWLTDGKDHDFTADEALANGLATDVVDALPVQASASRLKWAAQASVPKPATAPATAPAAAPAAPVKPVVAAATQPLEPSMTDAEKAAAARAAAQAENQRQTAIRDAFKAHAATPAIAEVMNKAIADLDCDVIKAKAMLLDALNVNAGSAAGHHVVTVEDEGDKRKKAVAAALEGRAGLAKNESSNPYRGYTLVELARMSLVSAGVRTDGMDKMTLVANAFTHGTSDFPLMLANVAQKAMLKGYDEAGETFQAWTSKGTLSDFKVANSVDLGSFPALRKVAEGGEYKYITVGERGVSRVLATYGEIFKITRQAVINDDLDAFSRIPRKMGRAAIRTVGNLAYAVLTSNPNMSDGTALFHANHGNLAAASAISTTSVDAMKVAMGRQKDIGQTSGSLNIRLAKLLVPLTLEGTANVVRNSEFEVSGSKNNTVPNSVRGTFEVIADARLDDASTSIWYGVADSGMHDVVQVDYLDGNEAPVLEQQNGWTIDGVEMKVRIDATATAMDWKTLQRNG